MSKFLCMVVMCLILVPPAAAQSYSRISGLANQDTVHFTIPVKKPDIKAIDCAPQRITRIAKKGENYEISLTTVNPYLDGGKLAKMQAARISPKSGCVTGWISKTAASTP